jgi:hypothetical protein
MKSRYSGRCSVHTCKRRFYKGDDIYYSRKFRAARCKPCGEEALRAVEPEKESSDSLFEQSDSDRGSGLFCGCLNPYRERKEQP